MVDTGPVPPQRRAFPPWDLRLTRRALLRSATLASASLLAACRLRAGSSPDTPTAVAPADGDNGILSPNNGPGPATTASPSASATAPAEPQVFYQWGFSQDPASHDFNANGNCGGEPELWAGLLTLTPDLEPVPNWAESWEVSRDGSTWTFHLRGGNSGWSNGDPVTAHDFVWSWQRKLQPSTGAPDASILFPVRNAEAVHRGELAPDALAVRAPDIWTLEVEMSAPCVYFTAIAASISTVPAHRASVERWGGTWTEAGHSVSNGPFKLDAWDHGVSFEISRNERYWNAAAVRLQRSVTPIIPDDQGLRPFLTNQVDFSVVPGADLQAIRSQSAFAQHLSHSVDAAVWLLIPQANAPPFDDIRARQAMSHAIDRERIVEVVEGRADPAHSLLPLGFPGHLDDEDIAQIQQFDVDAALGALDGTPYRGGSNWPDVTLSMRREDPDAQLIAEDVATQLGENLGMTVKVQALEPSAFNQALGAHRLQLVWLRWWFAYADANNGYRDIFFPPAPTPRPLAWSNPAIDELLTRAAQEPSPTRRAALYRSCEQLFQQQAAYIPVVYPARWYLFKPWVRDLPMNRLGNFVMRGLYTRMKAGIRIQGRGQA